MCPQIDLSYARDLITAEPHSRLYRALDKIHRQQKRGAVAPPRPDAGEPLRSIDFVRSAAYQRAVIDRVTKRYLGIVDTKHVGAALRRHNYDYATSEKEIAKMAKDPAFAPYRFLGMVMRWFTSTKTGVPKEVDWTTEGQAELKAELRRLEARRVEEEDARYARAVNTSEAERVMATLECGCCFGSMAGEDCVACFAGHVICRDCLRRGVEEVAYGAGRTDGIRCLSAEGDLCEHSYADRLLEQALPASMVEAMRRRSNQDALDAAVRSEVHASIIRCVACSYGELDYFFGPWRALWRSDPVITLTYAPLLFLLHLALGIAFLIFPNLFIISTASRLPPSKQHPLLLPKLPVCILVEPIRGFAMLNDYLVHAWHCVRLSQRSAFRCPCGRMTCMLCERAWYAGHECADAGNGLRLAVERAMAEAVKRTCRRCGLAFVKDEGCNSTSQFGFVPSLRKLRAHRDRLSLRQRHLLRVFAGRYRLQVRPIIFLWVDAHVAAGTSAGTSERYPASRAHNAIAATSTKSSRPKWRRSVPPHMVRTRLHVQREPASADTRGAARSAWIASNGGDAAAHHLPSAANGCTSSSPTRGAPD